MDTDELATLFTLAERRLPEFEYEIFADIGLTRRYLAIIVDSSWLEPHAKIFFYARDVMHERWYAAEQVFIRTPNTYWAYEYAEQVIRGAWPEAAHVIKSHAYYEARYAELITQSLAP